MVLVQGENMQRRQEMVNSIVQELVALTVNCPIHGGRILSLPFIIGVEKDVDCRFCRKPARSKIYSIRLQNAMYNTSCDFCGGPLPRLKDE
jgi:hypothetical protein